MITKRTGFTLVELLVVIAIIGIMISLLLPAVQAVRESARVVQCQNHLKQIALACHNYESAFKEFPGYGGETRPLFVNFPAGIQPNYSFAGDTWMTQTLPFMEQGKLFQKVTGLAGAKNVAITDQVKEAVRVAVETFNCPSRRDAKPYPLVSVYQARYGDFGARTDYAMNGGPATEVPNDPLRINHQTHGFWTLGERTKPNAVLDGLTHTYMVGEKAMDSLRYDTGDCFGDRSPLAGWNEMWMSSHSYVRYASRQPQIDQVNNCLVCHDFGSAHPSGWSVALADGSVQMVNFNIDMKLHRARASVSGKEVIEYEH